MKRMCFCILLIVGCAHSMDSAIHSSDSGKPLESYWSKMGGINPKQIAERPMANLYTFIRKEARLDRSILTLTPQQFAARYLCEVYAKLHGKILTGESSLLESQRQNLIEETGRTIEGILTYLIQNKKAARATRR